MIARFEYPAIPWTREMANQRKEDVICISCKGCRTEVAFQSEGELAAFVASTAFYPDRNGWKSQKGWETEDFKWTCPLYPSCQPVSKEIN